MNHQGRKLLAGVAALALLAGTGFASAQEATKGQQSKPPQATQQKKTPEAGEIGQGAQDQNRGSAAHQPNQRADETNRANKSDKSPTDHKGNGATGAERDETKAGKNPQDKNAQDRERTDHNTAQDQDRMKGEDATEGGNGKAAEERNPNGRESNTASDREHASGMHAQLTGEQRTQIRNTVINAAGAPRVSEVNFDVTIGTAIPRDGIHVIPVPAMLVQIEPEWRGFLYFVYEDEVVIVNPRDMRIVAVVPA